MTRTPDLFGIASPSQFEGESDVCVRLQNAPSKDIFLLLRDIRVEREGSLILNVPDLTIHRGEVLVVVGPNGAGKSTLLRVVGLLEEPAAGQVLCDGSVLVASDALSYRRRLAAVFQEPLLLHGSVADNVATGLRLRGVPRREVKSRVERWLQRLGIAELERRSVRTLSGGEAQRVSLARALVLEPELVLLDEPFASLDAPTRADLTGEIRDLLAETNTTAIWVTHERDEALTVGDRMVVLLDGNICQAGPPVTVFRQPVNTDVAAFLGIETVLRGQVISAENGTVGVAIEGIAPPLTVGVTATWPLGSEVYACLRPEAVTLLSAPALDEAEDEDLGYLPLAGLSARNAWAGQVQTVEARGPLMRVETDCGFPVIALVTRAAVEDLGLVPGKRVVATVKATAIHLVSAAQP